MMLGFVRPTGSRLQSAASKAAAVVTCVAIATVARWLLWSSLGTRSPYLTFFLAIVFCSWLAGWKGGAAATVLSLGGLYLVLHQLTVSSGISAVHPVDLFLFLVEASAISALGQAQFAARMRSRSLADESAIIAQQAAVSAMALANSEARLRFAIDGSHIGTWHWEIDTDWLVWSETMQSLTGRPGSQPADLKGFLDAIHPDDRTVFGKTVDDAIKAAGSFSLELRVVWLDQSVHWLLIRGQVQQGGEGIAATIEGIAIDVTERKLAEEEIDARSSRQLALNRVSYAIRQTRDPVEVQNIAVKALADTLHVDRCASLLFDRSKDSLSYVAEWHRPDLPGARGGEYKLRELGIDLEEIFPTAESLVICDIEDGQLSPTTTALLREGRIKATVSVPLTREGEVFATLAVYVVDAPRQWTSDEVSFIEAVAAQLHSEVENIRLLTEAQQRAEREALINHIGEVIRTSSSPDEIQRTAVTVLGEALRADRCYFANYNLEQGIVTIGHDWHRSDLPSVHGVHPFSNTSQMFNELYNGEPTSLIEDRDSAGLSEQTVENMRNLQIRSRMSVAIANTRGMATLTAVMADTPRSWLPDEVDLIEKVATQLRSAVEMARVQQREHRIAHDLQAALLPKLPAQVPRLRLASHMQPALDEAEIGGDFCDVFVLDKDLYAVVIGDVSGKGLAAAGQLATVRNSLRTTLYLYQNPAEVFSSLNTILTSHDLLIGFVTAFVGIYDAAAGTIKYASGGHEPGLVLRCLDGSVETLDSTGAPLGVSENGEYIEKTVQLHEGDVLLLYTDGISEAGPDRSNLLQTSGLIRLLKVVCNVDDLEGTARNLITEVTRYANGVLRDDVCVLIAKREGMGTRHELTEMVTK